MLTKYQKFSLKRNVRNFNNLLNSAFWGWLSMQKPEFRIYPENFHPCRLKGPYLHPPPQREANFILPTNKIWQGYLFEGCSRERTTIPPIQRCWQDYVDAQACRHLCRMQFSQVFMCIGPYEMRFLPDLSMFDWHRPIPDYQTWNSPA